MFNRHNNIDRYINFNVIKYFTKIALFLEHNQINNKIMIRSQNNLAKFACKKTMKVEIFIRIY